MPEQANSIQTSCALEPILCFLVFMATCTSQAVIHFDWKVDDDEVSEQLWDIFVSRGCTVEFVRENKEAPNRPRLVKRKSVLFDYFDEGGKSPLIKAAELNYLKTAFSLLLFGSSPDSQDKTTGDTALHIATRTGNVILVKGLLACNADPLIANKFGKTPMDVAREMNAELSLTPGFMDAVAHVFSLYFKAHEKTASGLELAQIEEALTKAVELQAKSHKYFAEHPDIPPKNSHSGTFLLSVDGGGVRAFNVTNALINIEERIMQLDPKGKNLYHYFDYIAGTSSGGIAACALPYLKVDGYSGRAIVHRGSVNVFGGPFPERGERMDKFLQDIFTKERAMADLDIDCRVIVTSALGNVSPYKLHLLTSYGEPRDGLAGPTERKVWESCRVSTAAPTYFPLLNDLKLLDGGLICNNPTVDSMAEIIQQGKREGKLVDFGCVVSIGTGTSPLKQTGDVELFLPNPTSIFKNVTKNLCALENLAQHFLNVVMQSDGQEIIRAQSFCDAFGYPYFRLTPPLAEDVQLDCSDPVKLIEMLYNTQMYYLDNPQIIDNVAKSLLSK